MIVWLNGTFGVGKTTAARLLAGRLPRFRLFDPEDVGYMLRNNLRDLPFTDFQQLQSWRRLVPAVAQELQIATSQSLVAVQSVLDRATWDDLAAGFTAKRVDVLMVHLAADERTLRHRILGDRDETDAVGWRLDHLRQYESARPWLTEVADLTIDTSLLTASEVADSLEEFVRISLR